MSRIKTGGRQKGSKNKTPKYAKYNKYKNKIIDMLSNKQSQAEVVRELNKIYTDSYFTKSGLCEYIRDVELYNEVEIYINKHELRDLFSLSIKKTKKFNHIYTLVKENSKYLDSFINRKTNKIHFSKHTLYFSKGFQYLFNISYAEQELNKIIEEYEPSFSEAEVRTLIYEPICILINSYDTRALDKMADKYNTID